MKFYDWYWLVWIVCGFIPAETYWLITNAKGTLSDTIWRWFGVKTGVDVTHWTALHFLLLAIMVWLLGHFAFRWWT